MAAMLVVAASAHSYMSLLVLPVISGEGMLQPCAEVPLQQCGDQYAGTAVW